ncbi:MAG TPA: T9SS type A sorting domain-containing protein [Bacteroidetes bacterium]|nr:T9SS type A sorting domain-containing protein [Bacteroidota bacterium]
MKKKPTSVRFQIPQPCGQPFDKMHPLPGGRHCAKCEKTIVDFTNMSDGELLRIYQKRQGRICGVFRADQLNRNMRLPSPIEKNNNWKAAAAFSAALVFGNIANGQVNGVAENIPKKEMHFQGITPQKTATAIQTIKGKVTDVNGIPLIGANIYFAPGKGTVSDIDGSFFLNIPVEINELKLTASYMGFETQEIIWEKEKNADKALLVSMEEAENKLPVAEVTAINPVIKGLVTSCGVRFSHEENQFTEKETATTPIEKIEPTLEVFPNPFTSHISINIELKKADNYIFHLYSEAGQLVFAETRELLKGTQTVRLDLNQRNLPEGIYFLRISDGIGEVKTKRVVKVSP